jgi:hypothetical protein
MKIVIKRAEQNPTVTIDLKGVHYPYAVRNAIQLALEVDGFTEDDIAEIFNRSLDKVSCEPKKAADYGNDPSEKAE